MKINLMIGALLFSNIASASLFNFFNNSNSQKESTVMGQASYFYDEKDATDLMEGFVSELHNEYELFVAEYRKFNTSYISASNLERESRFKTDLTAYSDLTFRRRGQSYELTYSPYKSNGSVMIQLDAKYNAKIDQFFANAQRKADFVKLDGIASYGRGGTHLEAKNIDGIKSLTLSCRRESHYDGSQGDYCSLKSDQIDFSKSSIEVFIDSSNSGKVSVPKKNLKTWADDFWNNRI